MSQLFHKRNVKLKFGDVKWSLEKLTKQTIGIV